MIVLSSPPERETWRGFMGRTLFRVVFALVFSPWLARASLRLGRRLRLLKKHHAPRWQDPHFKVAMVFAILISQLVIAFYSAKDVPQNVYQFLGVPVDVDYKVAKKAFDNLVKTKHSDHGEFVSCFIAMQEALRTIRGTIARSHHDFLGYTPLPPPVSCYANEANTMPLMWEDPHCGYASAVIVSDSIGLLFAILLAFVDGLFYWLRVLVVFWIPLLDYNLLHGIFVVYQRTLDGELIFSGVLARTGWTPYQLMFFLYDLTPSVMFAIALTYYVYVPKTTQLWRTAIFVQGPREVFEQHMWWRHSNRRPSILFWWFKSYVPKLSYTIKLGDEAYFVVFKSERFAKLAVSKHSRALNASLRFIWPIVGHGQIQAFNMALRKHVANEEAKLVTKDLSRTKRTKIKKLVMDTRRFASYLSKGRIQEASSGYVVLTDILLLSAVPVDFLSLYYLDFSVFYNSFVSFQVGFAALLSFIINAA